MEISERMIQNIFYYYPEILRDYFEENNFVLKDLNPFSKEEILRAGRIDLIFEIAHENMLHAIEVQLGDANHDHLTRLINYIKDLKIKYVSYEIKGYFLAESFSLPEIIKKSDKNNIIRLQFSPKDIYNKYNKIFTKTEKDLDLDFGYPTAEGFAKLEYFNGLFHWLDLNNLSSFDIKIIEKNQENILKSAPKGDVKTKRIKQILKFSERFNLLKSLDNKGNYKLTKLGEKYKKSLDRNNPWRFSKKMRNILVTSFLLRPFSSGVKLGIYNILKLTSNTYENIPKRELYKLFAFLCGKIDSWVSEKTLKDIYYFYSNYSEELGLIKRTPTDFFNLSVEGIKIFKIYDNYYKTYLEAKRYLLES